MAPRASTSWRAYSWIWVVCTAHPPPCRWKTKAPMPAARVDAYRCSREGTPPGRRLSIERRGPSQGFMAQDCLAQEWPGSALGDRKGGPTRALQPAQEVKPVGAVAGGDLARLVVQEARQHGHACAADGGAER